jgi:uncharacterized membrane protein YecN with MAPEG domain
MTSGADPQRRPRTWAELRQRVVEQDYLGISELEDRKRRARQMKYAIWLVPATLVLLAPVVIAEGASWLIVVAILLLVYGGIASYQLGSRWERRWDDLIREKSALGDHDPPLA